MKFKHSWHETLQSAQTAAAAVITPSLKIGKNSANFFLKFFFLNLSMNLLLYFGEMQNVNPGVSYLERCTLACARLLPNSHLHFAFFQSKATLPI